MFGLIRFNANVPKLFYRDETDFLLCSFKGPSFNAIGVGVTVLAGVAVVAGIVAFRWLNSNPAAATGSTV